MSYTLLYIRFSLNKQISSWHFSAHLRFIEKEWMWNHTKELKSRSPADGMIWGLDASHTFGSRVLSGRLVYELSCWSELSCQNITSNYRFGSQLSEQPPSGWKTPMPRQPPRLWMHIFWVLTFCSLPWAAHRHWKLAVDKTLALWILNQWGTTPALKMFMVFWEEAEDCIMKEELIWRCPQVMGEHSGILRKEWDGGRQVREYSWRGVVWVSKYE